MMYGLCEVKCYGKFSEIVLLGNSLTLNPLISFELLSWKKTERDRQRQKRDGDTFNRVFGTIFLQLCFIYITLKFKSSKIQLLYVCILKNLFDHRTKLELTKRYSVLHLNN